MKISGGCRLLSDVDVVQGDEVWKMTRCLAMKMTLDFFIDLCFHLGSGSFGGKDGVFWVHLAAAMVLAGDGGGGDGLSIWVCLLNDVWR
ncbi:hypothetical protein QYF36_016457 [Acer negundo]|nr:hypothetical protein QYF36_016457 [Acer negundo]